MFRASTIILAAFASFALPAVATAADEQNFIEFAGNHCRAFLVSGRADMGFALGKAENRFSAAQMQEFSRQFAAKIIREYHIDPAKGCKMDVLNMKPVVHTSHKPAEKGRYIRAKQEPQREVAVVAGAMGTQNADSPISVAYRFERMGENPWVITNITINGQPLVDRYRAEYEALVTKGGVDAVLD